MFRYFRLLIRELRSKTGRFRLKFYIIRNLPGDSGFHIRKKIISKQFGSVGKNITINTGLQINNIEKLFIGDGVILGVDNFFQAGGEIEIGDETCFGPDVRVWSQNHKFDDPDIAVYKQGYDFKKVTIGKRCWIGANVFIMPGAELGDGCIVSAGAVVGAKKFPPYSILAGNPARFIGKRERKEDTESTENSDSSKE